MPSYHHQLQLDEVLVPGVLSIIGSCSVILTYILFSDLRRLRYVEFVFYVSVNCLIAAIGACMGNVAHNKTACYFQDVTTSANNVSACFWAVVITYQLYVATAHMGQTLKDIRAFHVVCWLLPWILVFLPLTTNTFGIPDEGGTWCFIDNRKGSPSWGIVAWELISVYIPIGISIVLMVGLLISVAVQINTNSLSELMRIALKKLYLYPIVFLVCWIPSFVTDIYVTAVESDNTGSVSPILRGFGNVCPVLQGFLVALVFFSHNRIVRDRWFHALKIHELRRYYSSSNLLRQSMKGNNSNQMNGSYDDDNHKIQVMMRAENESDYIDDETRAAFAFRVSFSSAGSGYNNNNDFRPSDLRSSVTVSSTGTLNPIASTNRQYTTNNNNQYNNSRDSAMSSVLVLSSSVNSEPLYVGKHSSQGLVTPEPARGTLSSQPKLSFLHNNFWNTRPSAAASSSSSSLPRVIPSAQGQGQGRGQGSLVVDGIDGSRIEHLAASLSSSPPGDDPDTLRANTRSIQMSSVSTNSSSTAASRLRRDHLKYNCGDNEGLDMTVANDDNKYNNTNHSTYNNNYSHAVSSSEKRNDNSSNNGDRGNSVNNDDDDNEDDEDGGIQVEYTRSTNDLGVQNLDVV